MKKQKPDKKPQKLVRIDHKTEIEVDADIPDDVAIKRYLQKVEDYANVKKTHHKKTDRGPVGKANFIVDNDDS